MGDADGPAPALRRSGGGGGDHLRDRGLMLVDGAALCLGVDFADQQDGHAAGLEPVQRGADCFGMLMALPYGWPGDQVTLAAQNALGDLVGRDEGLAAAA